MSVLPSGGRGVHRGRVEARRGRAAVRRGRSGGGERTGVRRSTHLEDEHHSDDRKYLSTCESPSSNLWNNHRAEPPPGPDDSDPAPPSRPRADRAETAPERARSPQNPWRHGHSKNPFTPSSHALRCTGGGRAPAAQAASCDCDFNVNGPQNSRSAVRLTAETSRDQSAAEVLARVGSRTATDPKAASTWSSTTSAHTRETKSSPGARPTTSSRCSWRPTPPG
jgi:hypothetical protein